MELEDSGNEHKLFGKSNKVAKVLYNSLIVMDGLFDMIHDDTSDNTALSNLKKLLYRDRKKEHSESSIVIVNKDVNNMYANKICELTVDDTIDETRIHHGAAEGVVVDSDYISTLSENAAIDDLSIDISNGNQLEYHNGGSSIMSEDESNPQEDSLFISFLHERYDVFYYGHNRYSQFGSKKYVVITFNNDDDLIPEMDESKKHDLVESLNGDDHPAIRAALELQEHPACRYGVGNSLSLAISDLEKKIYKEWEEFNK